MTEYDVFVTFDLIGTSTLYDEFYREAERIGFTTYIPARYVSNNINLYLPNTTIFSRKITDNSNALRDDINSKIKNIYRRIGAKGKFIVMLSKDWAKDEI